MAAGDGGWTDCETALGLAMPEKRTEIFTDACPDRSRLSTSASSSCAADACARASTGSLPSPSEKHRFLREPRPDAIRPGLPASGLPVWSGGRREPAEKMQIVRYIKTVYAEHSLKNSLNCIMHMHSTMMQMNFNGIIRACKPGSKNPGQSRNIRKVHHTATYMA